jgi:hypothetical protein
MNYSGLREIRVRPLRLRTDTDERTNGDEWPATALRTDQPAGAHAHLGAGALGVHRGAVAPLDDR